MLVGVFDGNTAKVMDIVQQVKREPDKVVVVFPELTPSGYPPGVLFLRLPSLAKFSVGQRLLESL